MNPRFAPLRGLDRYLMDIVAFYEPFVNGSEIQKLTIMLGSAELGYNSDSLAQISKNRTDF